MDTLGCGILALGFPACTKLLGPVVPGAELHGGARVPGTRYELDPVAAAFNIGAMVRWLDFNDTWLAAEWGHPSDNLGAILAVADYSSRRGARAHDGRRADGDDPGARDPGRARAEPQLQPRRPRPRAARAHREHGGRDAAARRQPRRDRQRRVERVARRRRAAHLSARAEHGLAQELGRGRRHEPRRAARAVRARRRDGLSVGADREGLGLSGRAVQRPADRARAAAWARTSWRTCCSRSRSRPSSTRRRPSKRRCSCTRVVAPRVADDRAHRDRDAGARRAHHRQDRARSRIRPIAITACNTWSPCRCCSAA